MSNIRVPVMPEPDRYKAAINCEHHITDNVIRLIHDPSQPGHNALNQLGNRLEAVERAQLAARDAQWLEMVGPLAKAALLAIAALERTHHATEQDRESAANELRAALSAITKD
jgi:hypothetical protein